MASKDPWLRLSAASNLLLLSKELKSLCQSFLVSKKCRFLAFSPITLTALKVAIKLISNSLLTYWAAVKLPQYLWWVISNFRSFNPTYLCLYKSRAPDRKSIKKIFFLFLHKNICCGYSLEVPRQGASNEYPQHMCLWRNKKDINNFWLKKVLYLELGKRLSLEDLCAAMHKSHVI